MALAMPLRAEYQTRVLRDERWCARHRSIYIVTHSGFLIPGENLKEFFYDSFEGWYIESKYQGNRMSYTCEASARYKQVNAPPPILIPSELDEFHVSPPFSVRRGCV